MDTTQQPITYGWLTEYSGLRFAPYTLGNHVYTDINNEETLTDYIENTNESITTLDEFINSLGEPVEDKEVFHERYPNFVAPKAQKIDIPSANGSSPESIGSEILPVYVNSDGIITPCDTDSTWTAVKVSQADKLANDRRIRITGDIETIGEEGIELKLTNSDSTSPITINTRLKDIGDGTEQESGDNEELQLQHGDSFKVPHIKVDGQGRVFEIEDKELTLPNPVDINIESDYEDSTNENSLKIATITQQNLNNDEPTGQSDDNEEEINEIELRVPYMTGDRRGPDWGLISKIDKNKLDSMFNTDGSSKYLNKLTDIDDNLNNNSRNPVQNRVINRKIESLPKVEYKAPGYPHVTNLSDMTEGYYTDEYNNQIPIVVAVGEGNKALYGEKKRIPQEDDKFKIIFRYINEDGIIIKSSDCYPVDSAIEGYAADSKILITCNNQVDNEDDYDYILQPSRSIAVGTNTSAYTINGIRKINDQNYNDNIEIESLNNNIVIICQYNTNNNYEEERNIKYFKKAISTDKNSIGLIIQENFYIYEGITEQYYLEDTPFSSDGYTVTNIIIRHPSSNQQPTQIPSSNDTLTQPNFTPENSNQIALVTYVYFITDVENEDESNYTFEWNETEMPMKQYWNKVIYHNNMFLAYSNINNPLWAECEAYTKDDTTGEFSLLMSNYKLYDITENNDNYYTSSGKAAKSYWNYKEKTKYIAYSYDGKDWKIANMPIKGIWYIVYGNNKFLAIDEDSHIMCESINGIDWNIINNFTWFETNDNETITHRTLPKVEDVKDFIYCSDGSTANKYFIIISSNNITNLNIWLNKFNENTWTKITLDIKYNYPMHTPEHPEEEFEIYYNDNVISKLIGNKLYLLIKNKVYVIENIFNIKDDNLVDRIDTKIEDDNILYLDIFSFVDKDNALKTLITTNSNKYCTLASGGTTTVQTFSFEDDINSGIKKIMFFNRNYFIILPSVSFYPYYLFKTDFVSFTDETEDETLIWKKINNQEEKIININFINQDSWHCYGDNQYILLSYPNLIYISEDSGFTWSIKELPENYILTEKSAVYYNEDWNKQNLKFVISNLKSSNDEYYIYCSEDGYNWNLISQSISSGDTIIPIQFNDFAENNLIDLNLEEKKFNVYLITKNSDSYKIETTDFNNEIIEIEEERKLTSGAYTATLFNIIKNTPYTFTKIKNKKFKIINYGEEKVYVLTFNYNHKDSYNKYGYITFYKKNQNFTISTWQKPLSYVDLNTNFCTVPLVKYKNNLYTLDNTNIYKYTFNKEYFQQTKNAFASDLKIININDSTKSNLYLFLDKIESLKFLLYFIPSKNKSLNQIYMCDLYEVGINSSSYVNTGGVLYNHSVNLESQEIKDNNYIPIINSNNNIHYNTYNNLYFDSNLRYYSSDLLNWKKDEYVIKYNSMELNM